MLEQLSQLIARRHFLGRTATGFGTAALASLLNPRLFAASGSLETLQFPARAKRVIYLFMSGGPSHIDLFDYKPKLADFNKTELPAEIRMGSVSPA